MAPFWQNDPRHSPGSLGGRASGAPSRHFARVHPSISACPEFRGPVCLCGGNVAPFGLAAGNLGWPADLTCGVGGSTGDPIWGPRLQAMAATSNLARWSTHTRTPLLRQTAPHSARSILGGGPMSASALLLTVAAAAHGLLRGSHRAGLCGCDYPQGYAYPTLGRLHRGQSPGWCAPHRTPNPCSLPGRVWPPTHRVQLTIVLPFH